MSLFKSLLHAVRNWRRRRDGQRTTRRAGVANLERLDHRQLLSVTFTGNATIDIPDTTAPGTVILNDNRPDLGPGSGPQNGPNSTPFIPPLPVGNTTLTDIIKISGFDIAQIRLKYTPEDDILSVALAQPGNQKTTPERPVIAGDADNNLNDGTVDPRISVALGPAVFRDPPNLGGLESMGVFIDFNNDGRPDIVAGISNDPGRGKLYQVADAVTNPDPQAAAATTPGFGAPRPDNTGFAFLRPDLASPSFEFQIRNYSGLYQSVTNTPLTTQSTVRIGGFGQSLDDTVFEEFLAAQPAGFQLVPPTPPPPPPCPPCPPQSPPIQVNPHEHHHVNTAHPTLVRVNVFGSSGFRVRDIDAQNVLLGGAKPLAHFFRKINRDQFPDATFIFRGDQINLPRGITTATLTGNVLQNGQIVPFSSSQTIFNRDRSFYTPAQIAAQERRQAARGEAPDFPSLALARRARAAGVDLILDQLPGNVRGGAAATGQRPAAQAARRHHPGSPTPTAAGQQAQARSVAIRRREVRAHAAHATPAHQAHAASRAAGTLHRRPPRAGLRAAATTASSAPSHSMMSM